MSKTIPYFWVAFYKDGTCLPQFDLDTAEQHLFKEINQDNLDKFGLFPIPFELTKKLTPQYYYDGKLSSHILKLSPKQRLIGGIRREYQRFFSYTHCLKCGFKWQWMPNQPDDSIGDAGLPRYGSQKYYYSEEQPNSDKLIFEVICPKCGAQNDLKCPKCHKWWNKVQDESTKGLPKEKWTYHLECPECKAIYEGRTVSESDHTIENIFLLGHQENLPDGRNKKHIMFIHQDGIIEISDDYDFK